MTPQASLNYHEVLKFILQTSMCSLLEADYIIWSSLNLPSIENTMFI